MQVTEHNSDTTDTMSALPTTTTTLPTSMLEMIYGDGQTEEEKCHALEMSLSK